MAYFADLFGKQTDVLRVHAPKAKDVRWILLPVFAWRVITPRVKPRTLNVFQRAVLGLARAGVVEATQVADRLQIQRDLAAVVVHELQTRRLVAVLGRPTPAGLSALEDSEEQPTELIVGHVLTHATDGKIWPAFIAGSLPLADVEADDRGWPVLLSGSTGDPWRDRVFTVLPRGGYNNTAPSPQEVVRASHQQIRRRRRLADAEDATLVEKVDFVESRPTPYLLAVMARSDGVGGWQIDDPFDRVASADLTERVDKLLDEQDGLRRWLGALVGGGDQESTARQLQQLAEWEVEERLTTAIRRHGVLHRRLVAAHRALLEAQLDEAPVDKWDDVIVKAQKAMERLLLDMHAPYRGAEPPYFEELDRNRGTSRRKVNAIAEEVGFPVPLPKSLSSVRRGKVQHAEQSGSGSLRPLLLLTLVAARWNADHPLRSAAVSEPMLLVRFDDLAAARDRAAHEGAETWPERVKQHIETIFVAVEALILSPGQTKGTRND